MNRPQRPIRILVAEDEATTRDALARLLAMEPDLTLVGSVAEGSRALELVRVHLPDIVLTDIGMPGIDGIQLVRALRREFPAIGTVVLTIYNDDERVFAAIKAGARGYVLKDSPPEDILVAIRAVHRGESLLSPVLVTRILAEFGRISSGVDIDDERFRDLTDREREILAEVGSGRRNREIAERLGISEKTVKNHIGNIFAKLEINSRSEAALLAARRGLV